MAGEHIESRWTDHWFNERFDQIIAANKENKDFKYVHAYAICEQEHIDQFGKPRYSSYDSFRNCRKNLLFGT